LAEDIGGSASPEQVDWIESIRSVSKFALRLVEETLDLAAGESGTLQLRPKPAILAEVVAKSVALCRPLADCKQMILTFVEEGERRRVRVDPLKMSKVFNNLIENAIKFCKPGSRIEVRVVRPERMVLVSVHDNGPGIDPVDLKHLFTPFQRTRARAYSDEPGAGLGLVIAKQIVDLHDGRISVKSEAGRGTTFYVSLPA
jgi:signal transduction histidine kinase